MSLKHIKSLKEHNNKNKFLKFVCNKVGSFIKLKADACNNCGLLLVLCTVKGHKQWWTKFTSPLLA